jgi:MoxR-like ATPase
VLADEINRTSPKTQSALLEAMNDGQVSVDKVTHPLPRPFMLLATQNPLEYAGTFPLPESQLDRFAMRISIGYPAKERERDIIESPPEALMPESLSPVSLSPVISSEDVIGIQKVTEKVKMEEDLVSYILAIAAATRNVKTIRLGVSPRGTMALYRAAQAMALVKGRNYCTPDDIKSLAVPVFAHRIIPAQSMEEGIEDAEPSRMRSPS